MITVIWGVDGSILMTLSSIKNLQFLLFQVDLSHGGLVLIDDLVSPKSFCANLTEHNENAHYQ